MKSKKIFSFFSLILASLMLVSCGESFLEKTNPASLTYDKFYNTEADFQAALNGCYYRLKDHAIHMMHFNETTTDNTFINPYDATSGYYPYDLMVIPSSSGGIRDYWQICYQTISAANMVITRIKGSQVSETAQKVFVSEAKFIRAWTYFNMVRIYGGVPLYYEEPSNLSMVYDVGRATVEEIYNFIISDLIDAQNIDNERNAQQRASAKGKVSSAAVKALLGKVYLFKGDYANATSVLTDVINNSGYRLLDNLDDIYNPDTPFNDEVILAINYERVSGQNSPLTGQTLPKFSRGILPNVTSSDNGSGTFMIEDKTFRTFTSDDKRRALIDSADIMLGADLYNFYYTKKYCDLGTTSTGYSASDFILLRFADVLLMCADAANQSGNTTGAYQYVNAVRRRAGLGDLPAGLTKEQMNDALAVERQKEFICEGDRWFDLSFRGFDYLKKTLNEFAPGSNQPTVEIKDHMVLFPIPADQIDLKPGVLVQNTGY